MHTIFRVCTTCVVQICFKDKRGFTIFTFNMQWQEGLKKLGIVMHYEIPAAWTSYSYMVVMHVASVLGAHRSTFWLLLQEPSVGASKTFRQLRSCPRFSVTWWCRRLCECPIHFLATFLVRTTSRFPPYQDIFSHLQDTFWAQMCGLEAHYAPSLVRRDLHRARPRLKTLASHRVQQENTGIFQKASRVWL